MNPICSSLRQQGLDVQPIMQEGAALALTWNVQQTGPVLEDRAIVLLPDIHLSNDGDGDIFREGDPKRHVRLVKFLTALVTAREQAIAKGLRCSTVHLGDFYDVWRAYPTYRDHPTSDYGAIERPYADALDLLFGKLDLRACVGNHDATLSIYPPYWARDQDFKPNGRLAYSQRFAGGRVVAFHGHQSDQLQKALETEGDAGFVKAATLAAQKISNQLALGAQHAVDLMLDAFADPHLSDAEIPNGLWARSGTLKDTAGFHAPLWCDRINNQHLHAVLERSTFKDVARLVFVGHSHRAGVSAIMLGGRFVPVVDSGSWAWGRTQFGVAVEGEVSLWSLAGS